MLGPRVSAHAPPSEDEVAHSLHLRQRATVRAFLPSCIRNCQCTKVFLRQQVSDDAVITSAIMRVVSSFGEKYLILNVSFACHFAVTAAFGNAFILLRL